MERKRQHESAATFVRPIFYLHDPKKQKSKSQTRTKKQKTLRGYSKAIVLSSLGATYSLALHFISLKLSFLSAPTQ
jgi:hypothetical protein